MQRKALLSVPIVLHYSTASEKPIPEYFTMLQPNKAFFHYLEEQQLNQNTQEFTHKTLPLAKQVNILQERMRALKEQLETNESFLKDEEDPDILQLATEEIKSVTQNLTELDNELCRTVILENLKEEQQINGVILEIKPAAGGDEAALFAADLLDMYEKLARRNRWKWTIAHLNSGDGVDTSKSVKSVTVNVEGQEVWETMRHETGVHRVQRVPKTETMGRVHTSTVTVAVIPQMDAADIKINPKDLRIDTFRAQGAGGQHVNTTDSAVRIVHLPSGVQAECQAERSQGKNKDAAMKVLISRLKELEARDLHKKQNVFKAKRGSGDRSEKIRTYNYPQQRITDHRVGESFSDFDNFLQGAYHEDLRHKLDEHEIVSTFHDIFPSDVIFEHMQKRKKKKGK